MKLLAFSDMHDNMDAVRKLRAQEANNYDGILVAGDIGNRSLDELQSIVATFGCPTFLVFGNWDNKTEYDLARGPGFQVVHHQAHELGRYYVTGFSGCPTSWGKNPIFRERMDRLRARHHELLAEKTRLEVDADAQAQAGAAEAQQEAADKLAALSGIRMDRRTQAYRRCKEAIEETRSLRAQEAERAARKPIEAFQASATWAAYRADEQEVHKQVLTANRAQVDAILATLDPRRTILLTHERLSHLAATGPAPLLHVFGHRHRYRVTTHNSTVCASVAALDTRPSLFSSSPDSGDSGGYCVFLLKGDTVKVERRCVQR
ncbi:MAG: metallophosphoesterase family protein [Myxococcales bacterium]|nr:metallophosphoesterase family protein [Myxococcales bacterium]